MKKLLIAFLSSILMSASASIEENPTNVLKNWDFENTFSSWTVPAWIPDALHPQLDSEIAKNGKCSVKFTGGKNGKVSFMQIVSRNPQISEYKISGWMKTDNVSNFSPCLMLESVYTEDNATKYKYDKVFSDFANGTSDWVFVEKNISIHPTTSQVRMTLTANSNPANPASGNIWFDCIQLEEVIPQSDKISIREISPGGDSGLFKKSEEACFNLFLMNSFGEAKNIEIENTVYDYFNNKIYVSKENISLDKLSVIKKYIKLPIIEKQGFYAAHFVLKMNNIPVASGIGSFVVFEPVDNPDPFFGFTQAGLAVENIKTVRNMGAGSVGVLMTWKAEYEKGKYDWSEIDRRINECVKNGMKMIGGFLIYGDFYLQPKWILKDINEKTKKQENPYDEQFYKNVSAFENQAVMRYGSLIHDWSAINEIDLGMNRNYETEHYLKRIKNLHSVIKKVNPAFELGGIGVSGCDGQKNPRFPAAKVLWKELNQYLDCMAYDPYVDPKTFGPGYQPIGEERGNLREILLESLKIIKPYGKKSISIDEKGYDIVSDVPVDSVYTKQMAKVLARGHIIARSVPENKYWLYFVFKGAHSATLDYGLWIRNLPRPAVASYATVARRLAHVTEPLTVELHKDIYCFVFKKGNGTATALWTLNDKPIFFTIDIPDDSMLYDIMNNPSVLKKGKNRITISEDPVFIECNTAQDNIVKSLKLSSFTLPQIKAEMCQKTLSSFSMHILNQSTENIKVQIKPDSEGLDFSPLEKTVDIKPASIENIDFDIKNSSYGLINNKNITASAIVNNCKQEIGFLKST